MFIILNSIIFIHTVGIFNNPSDVNNTFSNSLSFPLLHENECPEDEFVSNNKLLIDIFKNNNMNNFDLMFFLKTSTWYLPRLIILFLYIYTKEIKTKLKNP